MTQEHHEATNWRHALFGRKMWICALNGFSSGLPLFYLYQFLPAWLRESGVDLKTIGLFALIGLPYSWKFLWSPLMDRFIPPFLGRRRGWMLVTQIALALGMAGLSVTDPAGGTAVIAAASVCLAFFSASQDIVLDAYRRELLSEREFGMGNAWYVNGYRFAALVPGGLGIILADYLPWSLVHWVMAAMMGLLTLGTLAVPELPAAGAAPKTLREAVIEPFREFFRRDGLKQALLVLAFLALYKLGDNMATSLATPFYLDMGFSKTVIGSLVKTVSLTAMLAGGFIGGAVIWRMGINRALWLFGVAQALPIFGFAVLSQAGPDVPLLGAVIGLEYLGAGLGTAALTAFMARATDTRFTASQFALLSSLIALPRTFAGASAGFLVEGVDSASAFFPYTGEMEGLGYTRFFIVCAFFALPGMALLPWVAPWDGGRGKNVSV